MLSVLLTRVVSGAVPFIVVCKQLTCELWHSILTYCLKFSLKKYCTIKNGFQCYGHAEIQYRAFEWHKEENMICLLPEKPNL